MSLNQQILQISVGTNRKGNLKRNIKPPSFSKMPELVMAMKTKCQWKKHTGCTVAGKVIKGYGY